MVLNLGLYLSFITASFGHWSPSASYCLLYNGYEYEYNGLITYRSAHSFFKSTSSITLFFVLASNSIAGELEKLQHYRNRMNEENKKYIDDHPELRVLVDDFIANAISQKPQDLIKFGLFYFNNLRETGGIGPPPVVIAGPSGVGKGTLIKMLMEKYPGVFGFSVSHTTRPPRPGEENGVHYNFVSKSDMEEAVDKGEFIEVAKVHTNMYGTSVKAVEKVRLYVYI